MRTLSTISSLVASAALLGGCVAYPVYSPAPVARLTPAQSAALPQVDPAERDRLARQNAEVQREDQADIEAQRQAAAIPYTYGYGYPVAPYAPYAPYAYYGYPGYGAFYPWLPGLSLSFGYGYYRGWGGGHRGWRGGYGGRWRR